MGALRSAGRRLTVGLLAACLLTGCTYADREPGLFGRTPRPSESIPTGPVVPDSTAPIPIMGEATWTTAGVEPLPVRIAVHGVRRVPGGTVLDWSITALSQPGRVPGDLVEGGVDLPLDEQLDIALVDASMHRVYRPLAAKDGSERCLCTPVAVARQNLVLDSPRLLQVAFPVLPATTRLVDVSIALAPAFSRVPVTPLGEVPVAIAETNLARPPEPAAPRGRTPEFTLASGQRFAIDVDAILASGTLTALVWTIEARTRGPGVERGLQPQLGPAGGGSFSPLVVSQAERSTRRACLCRDPVDWPDQLTEPGRRVTVVTTFGEIPRGTTSADVSFRSATDRALVAAPGVAVSAAPDGAFRSAGTIQTPRRTWSYRRNRPQPGWRLNAWPTPVPVIENGAFTVTVDRLE